MQINKILELLPGYNCGSCGYCNCAKFGESIILNPQLLNKCPLLNQQKYVSNKDALQKLLSQHVEADKKQTIQGVLDQYEADIVLTPLKGEQSCREILMPLSTVVIHKDDLIEYRPIGCPVIHFARVLKKDHMLIEVHIIGPVKKAGIDFKPVGNCMVIGFKGCYSGKHLKVGETVRFLPHHCMMQKVHSGVVVNIENNEIILEGIDLKVWHPPVIATKEC